MAGTLLYSGQSAILDYFLNHISINNVYVGLMENQIIPSGNMQLGSGITEITGSGYARRSSVSWSKNSDDSGFYIQGEEEIFTVDDTWSNANGYFVSLTETGNDIIIAEPFPSVKFGDKLDGQTISIIPKFRLS